MVHLGSWDLVTGFFLCRDIPIHTRIELSHRMWHSMTHKSKLQSLETGWKKILRYLARSSVSFPVPKFLNWIFKPCDCPPQARTIMYTTTALILAFSAFSAALPSLSPKEATCYTPTGFQVNGFSIFVPAAGNPNPESIYFYLADYATDTGTTCDSTTIPTTTPNKCTNANYEYLWTGGTSGGTLTIGETYTPCSNSYASQFPRLS